MARSRKKRRSEVYHTDFNRLSVYPSFQRPKTDVKKKFSLGDIVKVRITDLDDDGRPIGRLKDYTVVLEEGELEPGVEVRVEITRVEGRRLIGRPLGPDS